MTAKQRRAAAAYAGDMIHRGMETFRLAQDTVADQGRLLAQADKAKERRAANVALQGSLDLFAGMAQAAMQD
jgi:hypothetical protein